MRRRDYGEDIFQILSAVAFSEILNSFGSKSQKGSTKLPLFADLLFPGSGHLMLNKKYSRYIMPGYLVLLIIDIFLLFTVVCIPAALAFEVIARAISLKLLVTPVICESCRAENSFNAYYCSECNKSFDSELIVCPACRSKNKAGEEFCSKCETNLLPLQEFKVCQQCEQKNDLEAKFCAGCGGRLDFEKAFSECPECHQKLKPSDIYCDQCGVNVIEAYSQQKDNLHNTDKAEDKTGHLNDKKILEAEN